MPRKLGDEPRRRPFVEDLGIAELLVVALVHHGDPIGHRHRLLLVVGHVDERDPDLLLDPLELDLHLLAELEVEGAERLVEEEDRRPVDQGPGEGDPLRLAAGDLGRLARLKAGQLDELEHLGHAALDLGALDALPAQPERDVLEDRQVREQGVVLEDRVHVPLERRKPRHVLALELDQAAGRLLEPADHPERGRLAAAGRAEEAEELAVTDLEVDLVDRHLVAELLDDIDETDVDLRHRVLPQHGVASDRPRSAGLGDRGNAEPTDLLRPSSAGRG